MGVRETVVALRIVIDLIFRMGKHTYLVFVDIEKAFDNVNWFLEFRILKRTGVDYINSLG